MRILRHIRRVTGAFLRWLANILTGNTFKRIDQQLYEIKEEVLFAKRAATDARDLARRIHDAQQHAILNSYRSSIRRDSQP